MFNKTALVIFSSMLSLTNLQAEDALTFQSSEHKRKWCQENALYLQEEKNNLANLGAYRTTEYTAKAYLSSQNIIESVLIPQLTQYCSYKE